MNIKGKVVTLRAMEPEDQEMLREMVNDPEIEKMVCGYSYPVSTEQQIRWFQSNCNDPQNLRLIIETEGEGPIGYANITEIDWKNKTASHGVKISKKKFRAKGIATDTTMAVMRYVFEELQLNRLEGNFLEYNEASRKILCGKLGWVVEGARRQAVFKENGYHDEVMISILRDEYLELIKRNNYWESSK